MMKRTLCLVLVLVLLLGCLPAAAAATPGHDNFKTVAVYNEKTFSDVDKEDWYGFSVQLAYKLGLVKGITKKKFAPDGKITIAQTIALAARLHSIYHGNGGDFKQGDIWYQVYVDYCVKNKIIAAGQFPHVDQNATRAEFAAILANALPAEYLYPINDIPLGRLPDVTGQESYGPGVYLLYNAGVLTGSDKYGTFKPNSTIVRSEVATIAARMAEPDLRKTLKLKEKPPAPIAPLPSRQAYDQMIATYKAALEDLKSASFVVEQKIDYAYVEIVAESGCTDTKAYLSQCITKLRTAETACYGYGELETIYAKLREMAALLEPVLSEGKDETRYGRFYKHAQTAIANAMTKTSAISKEFNRIVHLYN